MEKEGGEINDEKGGGKIQYLKKLIYQNSILQYWKPFFNTKVKGSSKASSHSLN